MLFLSCAKNNIEDSVLISDFQDSLDSILCSENWSFDCAVSPNVFEPYSSVSLHIW